MKTIPLFDLSTLSDGEARGMEVPVAGTVLDVFFIRQDDHVYTYLNRCPHTGSPLNWLPNRFLDEQGQFILCATHGAVFRIEDGFCIQGPCLRQRLQRLATRIERGVVHLTIQE